MAGDRELKVVILGDATSAKAAMESFGAAADKAAVKTVNIGERITETGTRTTAAGERMKEIAKEIDRVGDKMVSAGKKASTFITLPVLAGMAYATKAASDLNEQVNKTDAVFGSAAAEVHKFAAGAAKDIGQSQRQAEEAVGTFGNLFNQLGIGAGESAKLSVTLTRLASDFASFHNADPTDVLQAMTAAFRGEYDAVQRFVPTINAAAVEHKALELGLAATTKELTAQDKALATNALLVDGAGKATGDFDRTQDSLANKTRIAKARLEDTAAALGDRLIPIALKAADAAMSLFDAFGSLDGSMQTLILAGVGVVAAIGPILTVAGNVAKGVSGLTRAITFLATSAATTQVAMTGLGLAVAGIAAGFIAYKVAVDAFNSVQEKFDKETLVAVNNSALFAGATKETAQGLKEQAVAAYVAGAALNTHTDVQKGATRIGEGMAAAQDKARDVLAKLADTTNVSKERIVELANSMGINLGAMSEEARQKLAAALGEISRGITPTERLAEVQSTLGSETATAAESFDAFKVALDAALGSVIDERQAAVDLADKVDALGASIRENGTQTGVATDKQRNLTSALIDVVQAAEREVTAITQSGQISADAATQKAALVQRLEEVKRKYPELRGPIQEYIDKINSIPQAPTTTPVVNTKPALDAIAALATAIKNDVNRAISLTATVNAPHRAGGGPVRAGQPYIVGEHHPELFVPSEDGTIVPNVPASTGATAPATTTASTAPVVNNYHETVEVHVGGSVIAEQDLIDRVHEGLLKKRRRDGNLGLG